MSMSVVNMTCRRCDGAGCRFCRNEGELEILAPNGKPEKCHICQGKGYHEDRNGRVTCSHCGGSGVIGNLLLL